MERELFSYRITNSAIILAILFGVLQYLPSDKTYEILGIESSLKRIAQV